MVRQFRPHATLDLIKDNQEIAAVRLAAKESAGIYVGVVQVGAALTGSSLRWRWMSAANSATAWSKVSSSPR